jgi:hypothetical protein
LNFGPNPGWLDFGGDGNAGTTSFVPPSDYYPSPQCSRKPAVVGKLGSPKQTQGSRFYVAVLPTNYLFGDPADGDIDGTGGGGGGAPIASNSTFPTQGSVDSPSDGGSSSTTSASQTGTANVTPPAWVPEVLGALNTLAGSLASAQNLTATQAAATASQTAAAEAAAGVTSLGAAQAAVDVASAAATATAVSRGSLLLGSFTAGYGIGRLLDNAFHISDWLADQMVRAFGSPELNNIYNHRMLQPR